MALGIGDDVYGFTNDKHGSHLFATGGSKKNSYFEKDGRDSWEPDKIGPNVTKITIPVTDEQYDGIKSMYEDFYKNGASRNLHNQKKYGYDTPYDYAIIGGRRCASSAYQSLIDAGILEKKMMITDRMFHSGSPAALLRYLRALAEENNWDYNSNFKTRRLSDGTDMKSNDYSPNLLDKIFGKK